MVNHNWAKVIKGTIDGVKAVGKTAKGQAAAGVALVAAHPVAAAFTVIAIVGVGVAIYYYTAKKEENLKHQRNEKTDDNDPKVASGNFYEYDPVTKSVRDSDTPTTDSNIRERRAMQRTLCAKRNRSIARDDKKSNSFVPEGSLATSDNNLDTNRDKILPHGGMNGEK